ncbi:hypothetical protein G6L68_25445 [Agrobacterium fabrum]|uniref:hypothetical protein n=1 Tax=Agrobacterium fabrum TaxID=1176649 RepID=UPI000EF60159|nr:hypothetical protein [Agrobacterium fabrum]AYM66131.1 hypothetical protein At12D13_49790 [Agrobacterium fabrum]NTE63980.1 hypothetical protein [Agrobacterium fabrum]
MEASTDTAQRRQNRSGHRPVFDVDKRVAHLQAANYVPKPRKPTMAEKLTHPDVAYMISYLVGIGMPVREIRNTLAAEGLLTTEKVLRKHLPTILNYPVSEAEAEADEAIVAPRPSRRSRGAAHRRPITNRGNYPMTTQELQLLAKSIYDPQAVAAALLSSVETFVPRPKLSSARIRLAHPAVAAAIKAAFDKGMSYKAIVIALKEAGLVTSEVTLRSAWPEIEKTLAVEDEIAA